MHRAASLIIVAILAAGCAAPPPTPAVPSASPGTPGPVTSPIETIEPTPSPTPPADALGTVASVEEDGVRVIVELEHNPLPAGQQTMATTTVTNTGADDLIWFHGGCAIAVSVYGTMADRQWRPVDHRHDGRAGEFQAILTEDVGLADPSIPVSFVPPEHLGKGPIVCTDIGISERVGPGASIVQQLVFGGVVGSRFAPPPSGRVHFTASFSYYWRATTGEPEDIIDQRIEFPFDAWIESSEPDRLEPAEAIDRALLDPRLISLLDARDLRDANTPTIRFDQATDTWQVGLVDFTQPPIAHLVLVDAATGDLVGWVEREWDFASEGNP
jgi:hypothetical protein